MPTKLFLRSSKGNNISNYYDMVAVAGSTIETGVVNTVASGTEIQWTDVAGGSVIAWISGRAPAGGFTLTSTDISIWAKESNMLANCGGRYRVFRREPDGTETELGGGPFSDGVEFTTSDAEYTWAGNVTDTVFNEDDRILIKIYITNVGTMASGHTCTITFNGADAATGDSFFNIAETVAFKDEVTALPVSAGVLSVPKGMVIPLSILTIAVNLLQTTLASADENHYQEQVVHLRNKPSAKLSELTITNNLLQSTLTPVALIPSVPIDQPNPGVGRRPVIDWVQARPQYYQDHPTQFSVSWENPKIGRRPTNTWINNNSQNTLVPAGDSPRKQTDWPNPVRVKSQLVVDISSRLQEDFNIPFSQKDWPNPVLRPKRPVSDYYIAKPQYYPEAPYLGESCPISLGIGTPGDITCFTLFGLEANPLADILSQANDFPNPIPRIHQTYTWLQSRQQYYVDIYPISGQTVSNPTIRKSPNLVGWIQPRPFYFVEPGGTPGIPQIWENPVRRTPRLIVTIGITPGQNISIVKPNVQNDWPIPIRKKRSIQWIDHYAIDDNLPKVVQWTVLPSVPVKRINPFWIFNIPVRDVDIHRTFDYPNPTIVKRHTLTWINNNLTDVLFPGVGEKPFFQSDYPNPTIANRILHAGWIQEKPQYYSEPPLPIKQSDWIVPRTVKRSHVGFVDFKIQSSDPIFTSIYNVPLRAKVTALTHIDNPTIVLISIAGIKPLAQNDWPLPVRIERAVIDFISSNPILLEHIKGRVICLLADETDYDLIAMLDEYDLDARMTEYDLESGGEECE